MIRRDLVQRKISLIQDELVNLRQFETMTIHDIATDFLKQNALERILEKIINRAIDINTHIISELAKETTSPPKDYRDTFLRLADFGLYPNEFAKEIAKSVGTRNILAHEYESVDQKVIYDSMGGCLRDYRKYCDFILKFLDEKSSEQI